MLKICSFFGNLNHLPWKILKRISKTLPKTRNKYLGIAHIYFIFLFEKKNILGNNVQSN